MNPPSIHSGAESASTIIPGAIPGAVVLGGDYQGLGIVRSLGRRGIPVCVIDDEHSISRFSKYCTRFVKVRSLRSEKGIIATLLDAAGRFGLSNWLLYPTREELVAAVSRFRPELSRTFRISSPEWSVVQWAWDKRKTYQLAAELGIPVPATWYPQNIDELPVIDSLQWPLAIKPAIKENFFYATRAKAWRANNEMELRRLCRKALNLVGPGEVMIQEFIPGGGQQQFAYCAFFRDGESVGKMVVRRRRQHPYHFGRASTYVETIDLPILEEYSKRFLRAINYYGLIELEFKLDPRDRRYKLLDVNARTWGYHSLGQRAGVDFSYMLYADQAGLAVTHCEARHGIGWMRVATDIPAALMAARGGDLNLREYLRSLRACHVDAVFSREDVLPGIAELFLLPYLLIKRGF